MAHQNQKSFLFDTELRLVVLTGVNARSLAELRVDTRKWLMARMAPKKYGDSLELDTPASPQSQYDFGRLSKKQHEDFMALLEIARVPDAVDTKFEDVKALTEGAE